MNKKIAHMAVILLLALPALPALAASSPSQATSTAEGSAPPLPSTPPLAAAPAPMAMMQPSSHIEGELAFLRAELKITDEQEKTWDAFAKAAHDADQSVNETQAPTASGHPPTLLDMMDSRAKTLTARLEAIKKLKGAVEPLYADLSKEQKAAADQMIPMHLGMLMM